MTINNNALITFVQDIIRYLEAGAISTKSDREFVIANAKKALEKEEFQVPSTQKRIEELQEKRQEFILNESVYADDHPSWGEVAEATGIAEDKWNETDEGKELKALLGNEPDDDYGYVEQKNFD